MKTADNIDTPDIDITDPAMIDPDWSGFVLLITLLSILNVLTVAMPLPADARFVINSINLSFGLILWVDFFYLLRKAPDKRHFMVQQRGWMVLLGNLPVLGIFRILWFRSTLRKRGRTLRDFLALITINRNATGTLLMVLFIVIVVFEFAVVSILYFEEQAVGSTITSVPDAFWWALVTVATVGYGDTYPVTAGGRIVAIVLMAVGIALFSVATSSLVGWFRSRHTKLPARLTSGPGGSPVETIAEIKEILRNQEAANQRTTTELQQRLNALESTLRQHDSIQ